MGLFRHRAAPAPASLVFTLDQAGHTYDDGTIGLGPTTLTIAERRTAVIGLNGSGKSTLLGLLDGTLAATCGRVALAAADGSETLDPSVKRDVKRIDAIVGRVRREEVPNSFRRAANVSEAVDATLKRLGVPEAERQARIGAVFAHFDLTTSARRHVDELDSEHRHLLAIAAALAKAPAAVVADEPTKGLDEVGSARVARALFSYDRQVVFATHDTALIQRPEYAVDRALLLDSGRVVFDGTPAEAAARYEELVRRRFEQARAARG